MHEAYKMKIADAIFYQNISIIFIRQACCRMHQYCFHNNLIIHFEIHA